MHSPAHSQPHQRLLATIQDPILSPSAVPCLKVKIANADAVSNCQGPQEFQKTDATVRISNAYVQIACHSCSMAWLKSDSTYRLLLNRPLHLPCLDLPSTGDGQRLGRRQQQMPWVQKPV